MTDPRLTAQIIDLQWMKDNGQIVDFGDVKIEGDEITYWFMPYPAPEFIELSQKVVEGVDQLLSTPTGQRAPEMEP